MAAITAPPSTVSIFQYPPNFPSGVVNDQWIAWFKTVQANTFVFPAAVAGYAIGWDALGNLVNVPNTGADQTAVLADTTLATNGAGRIGYNGALPYAAGTLGNQVSANVTAIASRLVAADAANLTDATKGAGMIGFLSSLAYAAGTVGAFLKSLGSNTGASLIGYLAPYTGAVGRTQQEVNDETVSALRFGADPTGVADSSAAFLAAHNTGKRVYCPKGTYAMNIVLPGFANFVGDGCTETIFKPFSNTTAAVTLYHKTDNWYPGNVFDGIGFVGTGNTVTGGVGVTCAKTDPSLYTAGDELVIGGTFRNCSFHNLAKGFQSPFGNLGFSFYECGFEQCYYGLYAIDNKNYPATPGSTLMHAGCKYFFGGNFTGCTCAVYVDNQTIGFGAIEFNGTIIENNVFAFRINNGGGSPSTPIKVNGVWLESNGTVPGTNVGTYNIDTWTGSVLSQTATAAVTHLLSGSTVMMDFEGTSIFGDAAITATESQINVSRGTLAGVAGVGGGPVSVTAASSEVVYRECYHVGVSPTGVGQSYVTPPVDVSDTVISSDGSSASSRWWISPRRTRSSGAAGTLVTQLDLAWQPTGLSGSLATVTGSIVTDGIVFPSCNEFSIPFTGANQRMWPNTFSTAAFAGWAVVVVDVKIVSGPIPTFAVWDGGANRMAINMLPPVTGTWFTLAAMAYTSGSQGPMELECISSATGTVVMRMSAFQVRQFASKAGALTFLRQLVYVDSPSVGSAVASATTIVPTGERFHVTGTTAIATITPPYPTFAGTIRIIPDGIFTTTTAGNIALASTAVVNKTLEMTYDPGTAKWTPSY